MSVWAVILCAGSGRRMGGEGNKTLLPIGGVPACVRCVSVLAPYADGVALAVRPGEEALFQKTLSDYRQRADLIVQGGRERQQSVLLALRALPGDCDTVLIHDGARCMVTGDIVERVLESVRRFGTGVAAVPARDTIKQADDQNLVTATLPRETLQIVQTPQGFLRRELLQAYEAGAGFAATDDASLMEKAGRPVRLVMGSYENIKLTSREDVRMAEKSFQPRIGMGYDAHRLVPGRKLVLCGERIPCERGLLGHSDADVATHALIDALLGAAAMGDIGKLFPDTDDRFKDICSLALLKTAWEKLWDAGFSIGNADVTIVAQSPRLSPFIEKMRQNLADTLGIGLENVSVKATTTEKMGFEGRGEGISAQAVALIYHR